MDGHFPPEDLAHIRRWCAEQSAKLPADALRIECVLRQRAVDIGEARPSWNGAADDPWTFQAVARLTYIKSRHEWLLGVSDAHGDFRRYTPKPTGTLTSLLDEVDTDPFFAFWG